MKWLFLILLSVFLLSGCESLENDAEGVAEEMAEGKDWTGKDVSRYDSDVGDTNDPLNSNSPLNIDNPMNPANINNQMDLANPMNHP